MRLKLLLVILVAWSFDWRGRISMTWPLGEKLFVFAESVDLPFAMDVMLGVPYSNHWMIDRTLLPDQSESRAKRSDAESIVHLQLGRFLLDICVVVLIKAEVAVEGGRSTKTDNPAKPVIAK